MNIKNSNATDYNLLSTDLFKQFERNLTRAFAPTYRNSSARLKLAVACSGGADSLLLALLTKAWLAKHYPNSGEIHAVIIDHAIRSESAKQAQNTKEFLQNHHISSEIIKVPAQIPTQNLQHWARVWRYRSLQKYCAENDIMFLLVGHNEDDFYESFWLNLKRGSGIFGLSAIAAGQYLADVKIIRPLLNIESAQIRHMMQAAQYPYIEDASNQSLKFTRVQIRKLGAVLDGLGFTQKRVTQAAKHIAEGAEILQKQIAYLKAEYCLYHPLGFVKVDMKMFHDQRDSQNLTLASKILSEIISMLGKGVPPKYQKILAILNKIEKNEMIKGHHIARIALWQKHEYLFLFPARKSDAQHNEAQYYDYDKSARLFEDAIALKFLGGQGLQQWQKLDREGFAKIKHHLPRALLQNLPAWFDGNQLLAVPYLWQSPASLARTLPDSMFERFPLVTFKPYDIFADN